VRVPRLIMTIAVLSCSLTHHLKHNGLKQCHPGVPAVAQWTENLTAVAQVAAEVWVPSPAWLKDPAWPQLQHKLEVAAVALTQSLAQELP